MAPLPTHIKYAVAFLGVFMGICIYYYYDSEQSVTIQWDQHQEELHELTQKVADQHQQELQDLRQKNANLEYSLKLTQKVASDSDNKSVSNWYDELIPEPLQSRYPIRCDESRFESDAMHKYFCFNITENMMRKTRPIVGNTQSLHKTLRKLQNKECLTIYVFGGSVTYGHQAGGPTKSYSAKLLELLNFKYPCSVTKDDGTMIKGKHRRVMPDFSGTNSAVILSNLNAIFPPHEHIDHRIDLLIHETNINDNSLGGRTIPQIRNQEVNAAADNFDQSKLVWDDLGDDSGEMRKILGLQWYTEAVIRTFLQLPLSVYPEGHEDRHIGSIPHIMFHADFLHFYQGGFGVVSFSIYLII